jgi:septum formation protein
VQLILASASPRRRDLLDQLGVRYTVEPADIDESRAPGETPEDYVRRMAREKAAALVGLHPGPDVAVLAADTTVVLDGDALGKPRDHADALAMLARLSGRTHLVLTAVCLDVGVRESVCVVATEVDFASLDPEACEAYLASGEAWDKAGAYAIQGLAGAFVCAIRGSYSNVVGLPLAETWQLLRAAGIGTGFENAATALKEKSGE